ADDIKKMGSDIHQHAGKAASEVKSEASKLGSDLGNRAQSAAGNLRNEAGSFGQNVGRQAGQAAEGLKEYAGRAAEQVGEFTQNLKNYAEPYLDYANDLVRNRPVTVVLGALGLGLLAGAFLF